MNDRRRFRALLTLNGLLLALLVLVTVVPEPMAGAQGQQSRPRGEYTAVAGEIRGGNASAIYIVDSNNQELIAVRYNAGRRQLEGIGYRDLTEDLDAEPGR